MQKTIILALLSLTALTPRAFAQSISFAPRVDSTAGFNPNFICIEDMDGDGKRDIIETSPNTNTVSVYRNISVQGMISLETRADFAVGGARAGNVSIGDIDGDGRPDLVVIANSGSSFSAVSSVSVLLNTSSPGVVSFAALVSIPVTGIGTYVAVGDIDGDGKPDVVVAGNTTISVFRNTSTIGLVSFASELTFPSGSGGPWMVCIGDIDGDGKQDVVSVNDGNNDISVLRNTSVTDTVRFAAEVEFAAGTQPLSLAVGDIDGDGRPDLAVANSNSTPNSVSVMRNTSAPDTISFAAPVSFTTGSVSEANRPTSVSIGDMDGDSKPELVVANELSNTVSVLRNTSAVGSINAFSFATGLTFATGTEPMGVSIGDVDGDGKPDLAAANSLSSSISVLRQLSPLSVTAISRNCFALSPNPTSGSFAIENNYKGNLTYQVTNLLGQKLKTFTATGTIQVFDISDLAAAIYLVQICNGEQTLQVMKIVKE